MGVFCIFHSVSLVLLRMSSYAHWAMRSYFHPCPDFPSNCETAARVNVNLHQLAEKLFCKAAKSVREVKYENKRFVKR